jgi:Kef-type K+ transport system membrane component KefB
VNELASLGIILLFALLAGHLVKFARVPEVTGYILAGIAVGPSGLGWLSHENLSTLSVFSEVALGLILFSIGFVFEISKFRTTGLGVVRVTLAEAFAAGLLVGGVMLIFGQPWQVAVLLGAISMETGAASTLMVLRECDSEGPLSETLLWVIGLNNVLCLVGFLAVGSLLDLSRGFGGTQPIWDTVYRSVFPLVWQIVGSIALGYLIGLLLAAWASRVFEHGESVILLSGCVLLCVGVAMALELSTMIASLAFGATMVNLSGESKRLFQALGRTDPPLYAIFFVIAGADLNLSLLASLGLLGFAYVAARGAGKFVGAHWGARSVKMPEKVQRYLGMALLSHAGLAVGLTISIGRRFPEFAPAVATVALSAVVIYEMIGPLGAKTALTRAGETRARPAEPVGVLD